MASTTNQAPTPTPTTAKAPTKKNKQPLTSFLSSSTSLDSTNTNADSVLIDISKPCVSPTRLQPPSTSASTTTAHRVTVHPAHKPSQRCEYNHEIEPIWEEPEDFSRFARVVRAAVEMDKSKDIDERKVSNNNSGSSSSRNNSRSSSQGSHLAFATSTGHQLTEQTTTSKSSFWRRILSF
ncbi:hypothetical protein RBB50_008614 [Rhinocladiella similis]